VTILEWLYVALAIAVVGVAIALVAALFQVAVLIATVRSAFLPQLQTILTESQKMLVHGEDITRDVEQKLKKLDDTVTDVTVISHSAADIAKLVSDGLARPLLTGAGSLIRGARAAWKRYKELQEAEHRPMPGQDEARHLEERAAAKPAGSSEPQGVR